MNNVRVCAVVVTYNRKAMLGPCLQSLLQQTRALDHIIIVNNASTDGTPQYLAENFPTLQVLHLAQNTGGSGGFHAGMRWAYENGFDWAWVMDDDIETMPGALESLLKFEAVGDLIQGRKMHADGLLIWESMWNASACVPVTYRADLSFENGKTWTSVAFANFEGALIRRKVMQKAGFPDERYFMAGDDTIYGFLASLHASVIYVDVITINKRLKISQPKSRLHYYLQARNRFLNYEHFVKSGVPVPRGMFLWQTVMSCLSSCSEIRKTPGKLSMVNLRAVGAGFLAGYRGRFGRPPWIRG